MSIRNVSIIIPCYKAAATLRRAAASALTDAPSDIEILLVDDGSPDDTGALCDELAAADPRITALHRENGGAGAARNTGLDAASGEWVLFLDADDALLPGLWSALDGVITDADMILFGLTRVSTGDIQPTDYLPAGEYADLAALGGALSPLLFDTGLLAAPYPKLFRRRTLGGLRFDDRLQINEDVLFNIQFLQISSAIYCLHGVYYKQYDTESGSLSRRLRGDLLDAERITRPALAALLRKSGLDPAPYEHTSRLRACLNQYGLLTGCRGDLPYARRRALFAEILADNDARAALQERLRNDPNKLLAVPYRIGVAWNWPWNVGSVYAHQTAAAVMRAHIECGPPPSHKRPLALHDRAGHARPLQGSYYKRKYLCLTIPKSA